MSARARIASGIQHYARVFYRPRVLVCVALLIGAFVAAPHVRRLSRELTRQELYLVDGSDVRISKPHRWVSPDFFTEAVERSGLRTPLSVADPALIPALKAGLEASPWIAEVRAMRADFNDGIAIHVIYRKPAMTVQTASGLYPLDGEGVVLPPQDFRPEDADRLPMLRLPDLGQPPSVGQRWRDERIRSAATIAIDLDDPLDEQSVWRRCDLKTIDIALADESIFELRSRAGSRVVWGRVGEAALDVEPSVEKKIGKLEQILTERGSLSAPAGPYLIDLRRWDVVTLEPLAVSTR